MLHLYIFYTAIQNNNYSDIKLPENLNTYLKLGATNENFYCYYLFSFCTISQSFFFIKGFQSRLLCAYLSWNCLKWRNDHHFRHFGGTVLKNDSISTMKMYVYGTQTDRHKTFHENVSITFNIFVFLK